MLIEVDRHTLEFMMTPESALEAKNKVGWADNFSGSFVCPHCGAHTQQLWGRLEDLVYQQNGLSARTRQCMDREWVFAQCVVCKRETVFRQGSLIFPANVSAPPPASDMPTEISADFEEARMIFGLSPRGAAALLRLCIEKLCVIIGAQKDDINKMIGELVTKKIVPDIVQKALDSVRVIGNECVHPGTMDIRDDHATVDMLFSIVNFVVEKSITEPKQIEDIFGNLPKKKLEGIAIRDRPKDST